MKFPKCKTCGKEHALGGCPEFKSTAARKDVRREVDNETVSVPITASCTQALPVYTIPDALSRADVVGRHLLKKANEWGWPDDGEGAFEYIQRISYKQGLEDGSQMRHSSKAQFNKAEYQRQYMADQRTIKRLGLNMTVAQYRMELAMSEEIRKDYGK